mmetsp:Transcript_20820/g.58677  ORF Transcript_20820/g.58677 Transcript_20820/m.58677 type:complete len:222 (+) Transcript_20820:770-1435(+)
MCLALGASAKAGVSPATVSSSKASSDRQLLHLPRLVSAGAPRRSRRLEVCGARPQPARAPGGGPEAARPGPRSDAAGRRHPAVRRGAPGPARHRAGPAEWAAEPRGPADRRPRGAHVLPAAEAGTSVVHELLALPRLGPDCQQLLQLPGGAGGRVRAGRPLPVRHVPARLPGHRHLPLPPPPGRARLPAKHLRRERPLRAPRAAPAPRRYGRLPGLQRAAE